MLNFTIKNSDRARSGRRRGARRVPGNLGAVVLVLGAGLFAAQPARAEFELSIYTGWQNAHSDTVSGNDPSPGGVGAFSFDASWDGEPFAMPPHYGIRGTWWWREEWGVHFDFNHTKAYASAGTLAATGFRTLEFTDGLNNVTLGLTRRWPGMFGEVTPYAGLGVGLAVPHVEVQTTAVSTPTYGYQVVGPNVAWMAGVAYDLNDNWRLFGEYKGTYTWMDADLDGGGNLSTNIWTNAFNFGISYVFDR